MTGRTRFTSGTAARMQSVLPGTRLNNMFEVESLLSAGGMGEVYKGFNIQTHDHVAVKVVLPEYAQDHMILELFRKEARILNHLYHDAIVRYYVFSVDAELGRPFLAMEFVNGPSLADVIKAGPLDAASVVVLQRRLADGLQQAHEAGVIHRDIAPDNIILPDVRVDRAKIIDFGIARAAMAGGTLLAGKFAGKYNFVSPEQVGLFSGEVSHRSDIYSLGLVLAACLQGHPLDMAGTQLDVVEKRRKVPDLSTIDWRLRDLLGAMLQPDPDDRPQTMAEIARWPTNPELVPAEPTWVVTKHPNRPPITTARRQSSNPPVVTHSEQAVSSAPSQIPDVFEPSADPARGAPKVRARKPLVVAGFGLAALILAGIGGWYYAGNWPEIGFDEEVASLRPAATPASASQVLLFVTNYDGGDCFFALPEHISRSEAVIIGFGNRPDPFPIFRDAFRQTFGFQPQLELRLVSDAQCPMVHALSQLATAQSQRPLLELSHDRMRSGEVLTGTLFSGARHIEVLMVDSKGMIYNLGSLAEKNGDRLVFSARLELPTPELEPRPHLIVSITSAAPILSLTRWPTGPVPAGQLVDELLNELEGGSAEVAATAGYLKIGG